MYYEEAIVDGILCYRYGPRDDFVPFTLEVMARKFEMLEAEYRKVSEELATYKSVHNYKGPLNEHDA